MSPKESPEPKPVVTRNSSEFKLDLYASIPQEELVVFAVQVLQADDAPAQTEDVVSTCFRFFPHSFALKNYFYWPDSALVGRRLQEAREKGLLKGNPADGFEVKVQGRKNAKLTAKALGVSFLAPPKVEEPAPVLEKPAESDVPLKIEEKAAATPVSEQKEKSAKGGKRKSPGKKKAFKKQAVKAVRKPAVRNKSVAVKKTAVTKAKPKPKVKRVKLVVVRKKPAPKPKVQKKAVKPAPKAKVPVKPIAKAKPKPQSKAQVKPAPRIKVKKPKPQKKQKRVPKQAKAAQLTMPLTPPPAKKKDRVPAAKPKVREEAQQVVTKSPKGEKATPVAISKEEKEKAVKVVKQVERSDAFRHFKKNGRKAHISEFEFRDMLFTTMETSPETLKRNVDTFKRYAGIRERADLTAFLEFCEERFSALLISKAKVKGKR
jgi:hypothetical protein